VPISRLFRLAKLVKVGLETDSRQDQCGHGKIALKRHVGKCDRTIAAVRTAAICALALSLGCQRPQYFSDSTLSQRIAPTQAAVPAPVVAPPANPAVRLVGYQPPVAGSPALVAAPEVVAPPDAVAPPPTAIVSPANPPVPPSAVGGAVARGPLTLSDAVALTYKFQPRLRAALETIRQAEGKEQVSYAAFLPVLSTAYSLGAYDLDVGGTGIPVSGSPGGSSFTFLPPSGVLPVNFNAQAGYELAELKLQWLVCDFGRRSGVYNQAGLAVDIAQLQTDRVYQTVANQVAVAYYQVLRVRSLRRIADKQVSRASDDLDVAKKLAQGGVVEREKVLRAQVALAQAQQAVDQVEEAEGIALAGLNLAIGLNVNSPTTIVDTSEIPPLTKSLEQCLQSAVFERREFQVARKSVQVAQEGTRVARADFAPRIVAEGYMNDLEQTNHGGRADLGLGFIRLEWGLFEGGKRIAEMDISNSRVREAMAEADSIADNIAFQVNQAYRQAVAARKGIDRSQPAIDQTLETYRLVVARSRQGDATPAELTDAQASLTRAQQDYANSVYNYLTALANLDFAMGVTGTPSSGGRPQ
jgi:outer membrane protein